MCAIALCCQLALLHFDTVQLRNNLTEKAFETRLERARQCVPFAFHSCSICVSLLPERIRERVPVTVVIRPAIIAISKY